VSLLGAFFAAVDVRLLRQVLLAELAFNIGTRHCHRVLRQVGGVSTHISDVAGFVQTLGHHHGFLHAEAQAVARGLLQGGGDERCRRFAAGRLVFALDDAVAGGLELFQRGHGLSFVQRLEGFTFLAGHFKAHVVALGSAQVGVDFPILFRVERTDLTLTLHHQLDRYRLHTTGGQPTGDLGP